MSFRGTGTYKGTYKGHCLIFTTPLACRISFSNTEGRKMEVHGIDGLDREQIAAEVFEGAQFVQFQYCVSLILVTFKRSTDIYYIRPGQSVFLKSLPFTLLTVLLGWWGIPWGPIYSCQALGTNLEGGIEVTSNCMSAMNDPYHPDEKYFRQQNPLGTRGRTWTT